MNLSSKQKLLIFTVASVVFGTIVAISAFVSNDLGNQDIFYFVTIPSCVLLLISFLFSMKYLNDYEEEYTWN